jgi:outer membrane lipoprotein SlyB
MKQTLMILLTAGSFGLAGCADMSGDQRTTVGALAGGAAGLAAADALGGDTTGKAVGTLAGAAAGAAIGASSGKQCRYPDGRIAACPAGY